MPGEGSGAVSVRGPAGRARPRAGGGAQRRRRPLLAPPRLPRGAHAVDRERLAALAPDADADAIQERLDQLGARGARRSGGGRDRRAGRVRALRLADRAGQHGGAALRGAHGPVRRPGGDAGCSCGSWAERGVAARHAPRVAKIEAMDLDAERLAAAYERDARRLLTWLTRRTYDAQLAMDLVGDVGRRSRPGGVPRRSLRSRCWPRTWGPRVWSPRAPGAAVPARPAPGVELPVLGEAELARVEDLAELGPCAPRCPRRRHLSADQREAVPAGGCRAGLSGDRGAGWGSWRPRGPGPRGLGRSARRWTAPAGADQAR